MATHRISYRIPDTQDVLPFRRSEGIFAEANLLERRMLWFVGVSLTILVVLYIYFVVASIAHVAAQQQLLGTISKEKAQVAVLETSYFSKTEGITESYARSLGFVPPARKDYVERNTALTIKNAP